MGIIHSNCLFWGLWLLLSLHARLVLGELVTCAGKKGTPWKFNQLALQKNLPSQKDFGSFSTGTLDLFDMIFFVDPLSN